MRNLVVFLLFVLPLAVVAQVPITITQNDMPVPGDSLRYSNVAPIGVDYQLTGAGTTWDYRNLTPLSQDRDDYVYSLATPYAFYFFGINQYGTKIADSIGGGPFVFTQVYNFFKSDNSTFQAEGVGFRYSGVPLAAYYDDEDEVFQFPMEYGDRDSSTFRFSVDLGNGLRFSEEGYRINEVDGWGTIVTPYDSVPCLRLVSTTIAVDTIVFNGFPFATPNEQITYKFLANGIHIPVLEINGRIEQGQFMPQRVRYRDRYQNLVAVEEPVAREIDMYPNPAQDVMTIRNGGSQRLEATLLDLQGKVVCTQTIGSGEQSVAVDHLPAGMYLLQLNALDGQLVKSMKVVVGN
jgi:hypothetical protein